MRFEFATASRILFGPGCSADLPALVAALGKHAFIVTDSLERAKPILDGLSAHQLTLTTFLVRQEPDLESAMLATRSYQEAGCDLVIGMGGGSSLDTAKVVAALSTNPGDPLDYLEVVGKGQTLTAPSAPCIAVPTTAGTGSEVTRNAVLGVPEKKIKVSLRSPFLLPTLAVVDPALTTSLPPGATASTGLDALTQLIEPFTSNAANPLVDSLCREGIPRIARSLRRACDDGLDLAAREDMSLASLFGGLALANARLGAVHGLAGPLGGLLSAPHGAICAWLLPRVLQANIQALRTRQPDSPALPRYADAATLLTGKPAAQPEAIVEWLQVLYAHLPIQPLGKYGLASKDFADLIPAAQKASSMKGNPVSLTEAELQAILEQAL